MKFHLRLFTSFSLFSRLSSIKGFIFVQNSPRSRLWFHFLRFLNPTLFCGFVFSFMFAILVICQRLSNQPLNPIMEMEPVWRIIGFTDVLFKTVLGNPLFYSTTSVLAVSICEPQFAKFVGQSTRIHIKPFLIISKFS